MSNGRDLFKVDITQIAIERSTDYLALLNFNLPAHPLHLEARLHDVESFFRRHFAPPIPHFTYQVTASYRLVRPDIGEERIWTGSFVSGNNCNCSLSGPAFRSYDLASFRDVVRQSVSEENVLGCLDWTETDTAWQFHGVESYILSFQGKVNISHPFFLRLGILPNGRRGENRRSCTVVNPR